jgi:hypothetical protein
MGRGRHLYPARPRLINNFATVNNFANRLR